MTTRTGIPSMLHLATKLCRFIVLFTPVITRLYPDDDDLLAALAAANAACSVLGENLARVRSYGT